VQDFVSYCRLVKCAKMSDGKHYGYSGKKIGNAHLKWAFSEAAVLGLRGNPAAQRYVTRLATKHGKAKALTILAHKLARAIYYMLHRGHAFDPNMFFHDPSLGAPSLGAEVNTSATREPEARPAGRPGTAHRRADHATPPAEVVMTTTLAD
jgi:hypothetical protein